MNVPMYHAPRLRPNAEENDLIAALKTG